MKNITVTVDDETYRRARIKAAEHETSISAVVRQFLLEFASDESRSARLEREERELRERVHHFKAGNRLSRDALYRHR